MINSKQTQVFFYDDGMAMYHCWLSRNHCRENRFTDRNPPALFRMFLLGFSFRGNPIHTVDDCVWISTTMPVHPSFDVIYHAGGIWLCDNGIYLYQWPYCWWNSYLYNFPGRITRAGWFIWCLYRNSRVSISNLLDKCIIIHILRKFKFEFFLWVK